MIRRLLQRLFVYLDPRAGDDPPPAGDPGAGGTPPAGGDPAAPPALEIPEKFLVKGEGDAINHEETLRKVLTSYGHMEKRVGTGDLPPETVDGYQLKKFLPDGFEPNTDAMKPVMDRFHKIGLTNKQAQEVMNLFGEHVAMGDAQQKAAMETGMAALKEQWGADYEKNVQLANTAVASHADTKLRDAILADKTLVNNPLFIAFAASVGADLHTEDRLPEGAGAAEGESLATLRAHPAYTDPTHPEHRDVVAKVNALYQKGGKVMKK